MSTVSGLRASLNDRHDASKQQRQRAHDAALRGAQLAFPGPSSHHLLPSSSLDRDKADARHAATSVAGRHANTFPAEPHKPSPASNASLGASRAHHRNQGTLHIEPYRLSMTGDSVQKPLRSDSPSNVAAALAAARYSPQPTLAHKNPRGVYSVGTKSQLRTASPERISEREQVPPDGTVNGVRRWLMKLEDDNEPTPQSPPIKIPSNLAKQRPKSTKPSLGIDTAIGEMSSHDSEGIISKQRRTPTAIVSPRPLRAISVTESLEAKSRKTNGKQSLDKEELVRASSSRSTKDQTPPSAFYDAKEAPTPPLGSHATVRLTDETAELPGSSSNAPRTGPRLPSPRRSRPPVRQSVVTSSAGYQFRQAPLQVRERSRSRSAQPILRDTPEEPLHVSLPNRDDRPLKPTPSPSGPPILARKVTPHLTGDSLANAIVAGSLASSRAPSPTKSPGPGFHAKVHDRHRLSLPFMHKEADSRTPSPAKGMRHTMRRAPSSSDDEEQSPRKGSRKFLIRKHPHKHQEGDRKRWREELTAPERKRYDGLWAANKGLHIEPRVPDASDSVSSIVVRDIWKRSRLPDHVLEEVWQLVDTELLGKLGRAEFVVGLWLIDQRLKGRKLPVKVQPTVWRSARGIHGLKMRKFK